MAQETKLGVLLTGDEPRDAVHVAVAPVVADERLVPGAHIGFTRESDTERVGVRSKQLIGVVDPFLTGFVNVGERFWLFLYPQTITSLRHNWTHPSFAAVPVRPSSEQWLRDFAEEVGVSYGVLMDAAAEYIRSRGDGNRWDGEYHILSYDTPNCVHEKKADMWRHYEIVTGTKVADHDATFFSCSC